METGSLIFHVDALESPADEIGEPLGHAPDSRPVCVHHMRSCADTPTAIGGEYMLEPEGSHQQRGEADGDRQHIALEHSGGLFRRKSTLCRATIESRHIFTEC